VPLGVGSTAVDSLALRQPLLALPAVQWKDAHNRLSVWHTAVKEHCHAADYTLVPRAGSDAMRAQLVAVGTWNLEVRLFALSSAGNGNGGGGAGVPPVGMSLREVVRQPVEGGVIPRS
jgi:hypothetical protein